MIIELQNFGPIKSFKFDTTKDIHAIFGKNNIGKSYAISAVYLILKGLREYDINLATLSNDDIQLFKNILTEKIDNENLEEYIFNDEVNSFLKKSLDDSLLRTILDSFKNTFDIKNIKNVKSSERLRIIIQLYHDSFSIVFDEKSQNLIVDDFYVHNRYKIRISDTEILPKLLPNGEYIYYKSRTSNAITGIDRITYYYHARLQLIANLNSIYYLPASRSGLYNALSSFGAIFAELSRNRSHITRKIEIPNMTEPISDYFLNLNTIDKAQANEHYLKHFEEIEQEILKGKITLDNDSKKYYYVPNGTDMRLELSFTSSMISEIAPIIAHLKYIIPLESDKPSILFIEEPEAHLHPEIQILLIEYFVKLCKGKVKIVMTSHSNYIFNKLSNLLIDKKIDSDKLSVMLMKMTPEGSVIDDSAMHIDEYGIEDSNFVDVAEQLYEERMVLLEKS